MNYKESQAIAKFVHRTMNVNFTGELHAQIQAEFEKEVLDAPNTSSPDAGKIHENAAGEGHWYVRAYTTHFQNPMSRPLVKWDLMWEIDAGGVRSSRYMGRFGSEAIANDVANGLNTAEAVRGKLKTVHGELQDTKFQLEVAMGAGVHASAEILELKSGNDTLRAANDAYRLECIQLEQNAASLRTTIKGQRTRLDVWERDYIELSDQLAETQRHLLATAGRLGGTMNSVDVAQQEAANHLKQLSELQLAAKALAEFVNRVQWTVDERKAGQLARAVQELL